MSSPAVLKFQKVSAQAFAPVKESKLAAGYHLKSAYDKIVPARGKTLIMTDIKVELPRGCYGRIAPLSGLADEHFIDVGAGVLDEDSRGNVGVILRNMGHTDFVVKKGDRIAQLICQRIFYPDLVEKKPETDGKLLDSPLIVNSE